MLARALSLLQTQGAAGLPAGAFADAPLTWGKAGSNMRAEEEIVHDEEVLDIRAAMLAELKERIAGRADVSE